jgi:hypothetical protein
MNFLRSLNWLGIAAVIVVLYLIGAGVACVIKQPEPPPAPQMIEWEVDSEYGDKRTTLPNGLRLFVYKVEDTTGTSTSTTWGWTVGSEGMSEREAVDRALHMGGVK